MHLVGFTVEIYQKDRPKHVECYSRKINLRHLCIWLVLL